jgi:hypothetical protein
MSAAMHLLADQQKLAKSTKNDELIATPFGDLTRDEVREWEKMLGRPLLRIKKQPAANGGSSRSKSIPEFPYSCVLRATRVEYHTNTERMSLRF